MTENEALEKIKDLSDMGFPSYKNAKNIAISALREIQQYREIGTVEECREAVEKQKPKHAVYESDGYSDGEMVYDTWICPNCGAKYEVDYDDYDFCPDCGQKLEQ